MCKKDIAIFQTDLKVGGIQKSLVNLLNNIDTEKYNIDLYLFDKQAFFNLDLNKNINIIYLKKYNFFNRFVFFDIIKFFKKNNILQQEYDAAIDFSSYSNECALNTICVKAKKKIMWIHNDMEKKREDDLKYRILFFFFKGKFKYYDEFVAVSSGIVEPFRKLSGIQDKKVTIIPNYVGVEEIFEKSKEPLTEAFSVNKDKYNLVSVGRLCHQKGFDILINYMSEIVKERKDVHLYIIGDGPDKEKLEHQIKNMSLENYITLLGKKVNPYTYMNIMDGFVLTSRYEGQGIVLLEAKTLGLEIFIPEHLEKYNSGIKGYDDVVDAIAKVVKKEKNKNSLDEYNNDVMNKMDKLFCG